MGLQVVGAGLGRTGTHSLKLGLEMLLGTPCYHMIEVFKHPEHVPAWHSAAIGEMPDWDKLFEGYSAAVDWPASAYWKELSETYPDALVLLSVRDPEAWWRSTQATIFKEIDSMPGSEWRTMVNTMFESRFTSSLHDHDACVGEFLKHNEEVRKTINPNRLVEWQASQGWEPLCAALGVPVPNEPFPRTNTTEEWAARHAKADAPTGEPVSGGS